ncbi:hypothetical protein LSCM1_07399 [Leishmania martiniquensis]|uniref:Uncharacterized protein n=1 Tax=Leishmania martiniquensis TaxID=1580590 RepID=A0A836KUG5_9TRYP|nr:hypothetical protein LSCM1_07399 [Leishmania martiniquensis]
MRRCLTPVGGWLMARRSATTVSGAAGYLGHRPPLTMTGKAASAMSTTAAAAPTSEDYRALLLDLLLYRRETLSPVVEALRRERDEVEKKMQQLDTHVRELASIRDELRQVAEEMRGAEHSRLHNLVTERSKYSVVNSTKAAQVAAASGEDEEIVL